MVEDFQNYEIRESCSFAGGARVSKALVLLSGGIDSATALYLVKQQFDELYSLNLVYTQSYDNEAEAAKKVASEAQVEEHLSVYAPFFEDISNRYRPRYSDTISSAYVPARNIVFHGIAAAYAEAMDVGTVVIGSNADDAKELPDARSNFVQLMNDLLKMGTRTGMEGTSIAIMSPLIELTKPEVVRLALRLKVPLQYTWSCYGNAKIPCGKCRGCRMRAQAFTAIGARDPLTA